MPAFGPAIAETENAAFAFTRSEREANNRRAADPKPVVPQRAPGQAGPRKRSDSCSA